MDAEDSPESLPDLENLDSASQMAHPGTTAEPSTMDRWRCAACDSSRLARDPAGFWSCEVCSSTLYYRVDRPTTRQAAHGQGTWHYVPLGGAPPTASSARTPDDGGPPAADPGSTTTPLARPAAGNRRRRRRRGPPRPPGDEDAEASEQPESEALTYDPTVSASSVPSRRAVRHDPWTQPASPHRLPPGLSPGARAPRLPGDNDQGQRGGDDPAEEHPSHLLDFAAAHGGSPGKLSDKDPKSSPAASWTSRMGPEKNVKWRGGTPPTPPPWRYDTSDLRAFSKWMRKVQIWQVQIANYMTKREAALLLYTSLTGEAEAELEHVPLEKINCDSGVEFILESLKEPMAQKTVYQKRKFLADFESISRYPNEGLRTYANRYRRIERSLEALGVQITGMYDDESRGNRLLERARLSQADQRLVLVGSRYSLSFEDVMESMTMQYPEFRAAPPVMSRDGQVISRGAKDGKGAKPSSTPGPSTAAPTRHHVPGQGKGGFPPRRVFYTETGETYEPETGDAEATASFETIPEDPAEDEQNDQGDHAEADQASVDDDGDELRDLAQVLTVTARRLASTRLGRKYSGSKVPTAELKKKTACAACGELGHWRGDPECRVSGGKGGSPGKSSPSKGNPATSSTTTSTGKSAGRGNGTKGQPHQAFTVTHSDLGSYEVYSEQYGRSFGDPSYDVHVVFSAQMLHDVGSQFIGYMVLDTACQRTCCGRSWAQKHFDFLDNINIKPAKAQIHDKFQFGKGPPVEADYRAYVPVSIGSHNPVLIGAGVLDADVPLLASNMLLKALGMVLDLPNMSVKFMALGCSAPVHMINGHLTARIDCFDQHACDDFSQLLSRASWHDAPPEVIFGQTVSADESESRHACGTPGMAHSLAPTRDVFAQLPSPPLHDHGSCGEARYLGSSMAPGGNTTQVGSSLPGVTGELRPSGCAAVRKRHGKVLPMQGVQQEMALGSRPRAMGAQTVRRIFALIGTAIALFGQHPGDPSAGTPSIDFTAGGPGQDEYGTTTSEHSNLFDGIRADYQDPTLPGARGGSLGSSSRPQAQRHRGGDHIGGARLGQRRRVIGDLERAARVYQNEVNVYHDLPTTSSRPPPNVDILEIFTSEAKTSARAHHFGLNACQPIDLQYGWDLRQDDHQWMVDNLVRRLRPWAIIIDYPSRLYSVHNHYHDKPDDSSRRPAQAVFHRGTLPKTT